MTDPVATSGPDRTTIRRHSAEQAVDAHLDAAADAAVHGGRVRIAPQDAGQHATRDARLVRARTDPGWPPFSGRVGELGVDAGSLLVGIGDEVSPESARKAGAALGAVLAAGQLRLDVDTAQLGAAEVTAFVGGIVDTYAASGTVALHVSPQHVAAAELGIVRGDAAALARAVIDAPANVVTPARFAQLARRIADQTALTCRIWLDDDLETDGFGALRAIGGGSPNRPLLVRLEYRPAGEPVGSIGLIGKGITFDSGGLSLKSADAMQAMRSDVAGAATVLGAMSVLHRLEAPVRVVATLPIAENLPGPGAARPGDLVTAWDGTTIQLLDLDFEGRVVLADALAFAATDHPDLLIDIATLTYQASIALGPEIAAVLGRGAAVPRLLRAAELEGEPMWELPLATRYLNQVRTPLGVRNHPLHPTGRAITAALFLAEFVPPGIPWAHIDMTAPAWQGDASTGGATGFGVRSLLRLLADASFELSGTLPGTTEL